MLGKDSQPIFRRRVTINRGLMPSRPTGRMNRQSFCRREFRTICIPDEAVEIPTEAVPRVRLRLQILVRRAKDSQIDSVSQTLQEVRALQRNAQRLLGLREFHESLRVEES